MTKLEQKLMAIFQENFDDIAYAKQGIQIHCFKLVVLSEKRNQG